MKIAYVMTSDRGATDRFLFEVAQSAIERGLSLAGVVQKNTPRPKTHRCDMDVQVLPDGPLIRISQDLGLEATGCALNPDALEQSVAAVEEGLSDKTDLLIVNKFGKHEADGRGFRPLIGEALTMDVPVLVGLNEMNRPRFEKFCDGMAQQIKADHATVAEWIDQTKR